MSKQHPHKHSKKKPQAVNAVASAEGHRKRHHPQGKRKHESLTKQSKKKALLLRRIKMRERKQKHPVISKTNKIFSDR